MAVERVAKVLVLVHRDSSESFLESLQRQGIFHVVSTQEAEPSKRVTELDRRLDGLSAAIGVLSRRQPKRVGLLEESRVELSRPEFDRVAAEYDPREHLSEVQQLTRELDELGSREKAIKSELERLRPWEGLDHAPSELYELGSFVVLGRFADPTEYERATSLLADQPAATAKVGEGTDGSVAVVVLAAAGAGEEVERVLRTLRFEFADLRNVSRKPAEVVRSLENGAEAVVRRRNELEVEVKRLTAELPKLSVAAERTVNALGRSRIEGMLESTGSVLLVRGWVRERHLARLRRLVERTGVATLVRQEPEPGEEPPVALVNRRVFRPFQLVPELFSLPSSGELDPTALLAPFFAIFFGFCLTDAGYGIALVVIAALLMRRLGAGNKLLGMLFIGGFFTIVAGALVGGWFGNLPDKLGWAPFMDFKTRLMWFDPLKNPMPFFILSLGMGYLHMMYGFVIEIVDDLRVRRFGDALLGQLPWFLALNSLAILVLLGRSLPGWCSQALLVLILASVAAIVVFTQRAEQAVLAQTLWFGLCWFALVYFAARLGGLPPLFLLAKWLVLVVFAGVYALTFVDLVRTGKLKVVPLVIAGLGMLTLGLWLWGWVPWVVAGLLGLAFFFTAPVNRKVAGRLAWGGYALYGATSYVGVVLSYIRIMALGMVTGGIAMAINTVAWMVTGIPVLGIVVAVVVLAIGHTYNIAVNVLGAFVHTLRLNYVEFFPRFYTGGGEPFVPFRETGRFVAVQE